MTWFDRITRFIGWLLPPEDIHDDDWSPPPPSTPKVVLHHHALPGDRGEVYWHKHETVLFKHPFPMSRAHPDLLD